MKSNEPVARRVVALRRASSSPGVRDAGERELRFYCGARQSLALPRAGSTRLLRDKIMFATSRSFEAARLRHRDSKTLADPPKQVAWTAWRQGFILTSAA